MINANYRAALSPENQKELAALDARFADAVNSFTNFSQEAFECYLEEVNYAVEELSTTQKFAVVTGVLVRAAGKGDPIADVLAIKTLETALIAAHTKIAEAHPNPLFNLTDLLIASAKNIAEASGKVHAVSVPVR